MNQAQQDLIRDLLKQTEKLPINEGAKAKAIQLAMAEFDQSQQKSESSPQGITERPRLITESTNGSKTMQQFKQKWIYSGLAAASVAAFSIMVIHQSGGLDIDPVTVVHPGDLSALTPVPSKETKDHPSQDATQSLAGGAESKREEADESQPTLVMNQAKPESTNEVMTEVFTHPIAEASQVADAELSRSNSVISSDAGTSPAKKQVMEFDAKSDSIAKMKAPASTLPLTAEAHRQQAVERLQPAQPAVMQQGLIGIAPHMPDGIIAPSPDEHRDQFKSVEQNPIKQVKNEPVSTFSIDVDTASYSFVRRQLNQGIFPSTAAVRLEEMVNYFDYAYPMPESREVPFKTTVSVTDSPWKAGNQLVHIGIKGYQIAPSEQPKSNLVFLLDVSGSMSSEDKLPLVKQSMHLLLSQLKPDDTVAIVVYAGAAGTVLEPTAVKDKSQIMNALNRLNAGGSTAGAQGIELAYQLAEANFNKQAVNRIILATDGDFNVGITNPDELKNYVERKRDKGIFLSVLGFGQGNYNDHLMQQLAQHGNGVAAYIDTLSEAQKVLVNEATSSLFTIAKDVKIQVEFNPATVSEYRLLGYETRALKQEDFNNDKVDAGDIGAGHTVTAIYEITPTGGNPMIDQSRYQPKEKIPVANANELGYLKLRYKLPYGDTSSLIETPILKHPQPGSEAITSEVNFAIAVAGFAQLLQGGQYTGQWNYEEALKLAQANKGADEYGYRTELVQLIRKAQMAKGM